MVVSGWDSSHPKLTSNLLPCEDDIEHTLSIFVDCFWGGWFGFLKYLFLSSGVCVCVPVRTHTHACVQMSAMALKKRALGLPGAGVTGICGLPDAGAGN